MAAEPMTSCLGERRSSRIVANPDSDVYISLEKKRDYIREPDQCLRQAAKGEPRKSEQTFLPCGPWRSFAAKSAEQVDYAA